MLWLWFVLIIGGYLLGGVMFCRALPLLFKKKDICELFADKNPGAFNVFSSCGVGMGMVCLLCDILKGFIPVFLGCMFLNTQNLLFFAVILAPVLGHAMGVFNSFHGGKCISTSFGVVLGLLPVTWVGLILAGAYIFFSVFVKLNPHRRRSLAAFAIFGITACIVLIVAKQYSIALGCLALSTVAVIKHSSLFATEEEVLTEAQLNEEEDELFTEN
ncbi:MAG: glycerol-3-phosphate acyltransferase [Clostridia bacterium]|nr:glycerol-3-phosphate acyltransferase [Clostridia bacterium]